MAGQQSNDDVPTEMYKKRSGTTNVGQLYETKLLSLILFRLHHLRKFDSFCLGSNIADIGAFDDIVLKTTVGGKTRMQFVQLKHKRPEFTVNFEDLFKKEDKKDDFSLLKYFNTYLKIRIKFSTASTDVMFQGEFENMGVDLIIFTNARFTFPEKVCTIKNTDSSDILYTKCSGKTVKIECSEAVLKYLQTESVMWHKKVFGEILTKIILLQDYNTSDLADTISKIMQKNVAGENNDFNCSNFLRLYSNQQLPAVNNEAFSKLYDKIVNMIDETLVPTIDEHSSLVKDFLAKLSFYSEQATDDVLDALTRRVMKSMIYPDESLFLNKFYDFVGNFFKKSNQNQYLTEQCNFLEKIENEIKLEEMHSKSLGKIICDFLNFRKMYLKNKKISNIFQRLTQNEPCIINIVSSTPELSCIKFVQLLQFQEIKFAFLTIDNENSERMQEVLEKVKPLFIIVIYLPEFNLKLVENIYRNATKLLIITKNEPKGNITSVTETMINLLDLENHSQEMVLETPVVFQGASVSLNVLLGNAPRELIDGEVLQKIYSGETLVVGKPCSLNEPIKYYIDRTLCDSHNQQVSKSITEIFDRVVIIAADPGMGKTTFFAKHVAEIKKYNPSCWIVSLNLLDYSRQFSEWKNDKRVLNEDDAFKFLSMVCQMNHTESFERRILDWYCQQCKVYLIVDGFDEISFDHSRVVLGLLRIYNYKFAAKLWITTRAGGIQQDLEEHLEVSAFTLKPFTSEQTKLYLGNFWADKGKQYSTDIIEIIFSRLCSLCNNDERDLISTPLHLNMIATVFHDQFNDRFKSKSNNIQGENLNLISLYEKFINMTFNLFPKKRINQFLKISDSSKRLADFFQEFQNKHKKMAIFALFDHANQSNLLDAKDIDDVEKCIQKMSNLSEKTGLIEKIVDGKPIFVHHTFAEYFAALFIWNKYASLSNEDSTKFIDVVFINSIITPDRYQIAKFLSGMANKRKENTPNITNKTSVLLDRLVDNLPCSCRDFGRKSFGYMLGIVEWCLNPENECCFELSKVLMDKPHDCVNLLLLKASESGHKRLVRLIIEYFLETSSDINSATTKNGQTALHMAVQNGYADIVELLVQKGANINSTTFDDGRTPLYQASINGALDAVKVLLELGANINLGTTDNAYTPLHCAAQKNFPEIIKLLIHKGANIDCTTSDNGRTPLFEASINGALDAVKVLLKFGAYTNLGTTDNAYTPLHCAAQKNFPEIIKLLIHKGANIDCTTSDNGRTPLFEASINGALDAVKVLLKFGAYTNLGKTNNAYTPLHCAAQKNFPEIIKLLIRKGANIDCTTTDEGRTPLFEASINGALDAVKVLLEFGANTNLGSTDNAYTPLHCAAQKNFPEIIKLLIHKGANVDCTTSDEGRTPLYQASNNGAFDAVKELLELGANANLGKTDNAYTPLHCAAQKNFPEIIKLLIHKGANVDCTTSDNGRTPLFEASINGALDAVKMLLDLGANVHLSTLDNATSALHLAASNDNPEIIRLLVDRGANVHCTTTDDGRTPLHEACANGALNAVQIILNMGANVNIKTTDKGLTPLHLAAQKNYTDIIEILIDYGADIDNPSWENGRTPLFLASKNGAIEATKMLLDLGANVNLGDKDNGYTPLHYAAQKDLPEIIQLLVERGANIDSTTTDNGHTPLFEACRNRALKAVKMLLNLGANARIGSRDTNFSPLHLAAQQDCPEVIKLLVDCGANIDSTTMYDGATPLVEACRVNAVSAVKMLLELGANVHLGTFDKGATPLHFAACNDNPEIVKLLLHRGANIDCLTTDDGRTPLYEACQNNALSAVKMLLNMGANPNLSTSECEYSPLHIAAINNCTEIIKLLTESGANIDSVTWDYGRTALYEAFKNDAMDAVKILLQLGAKVNLHEEGKANYKDEKHTSYFHKALDASGIPTLVNNLLGKGEKRKNDYEHEGKNERQLKTDQSSFSTLMRNMQMMCAIENNNLLEVERLLKSGADINFVNIHENHETPLHAAVLTGNYEIVTLLLANGANVEAKNSDNLKPVDLMSTILEYEKKQAVYAAFEKHFKQNESTKGPSECNATYLKRPGTAAIRGQCYETKLSAMVLFRLLHDDRIECFQLGSNMDEAGAFDDVVLRTTVQGKSRVCCLQAKHAKRSVHFDDLDKKGKTFQDQQKGYLESYLNLRYMFSAYSGNIIFQNHFEKTELEVIVFTPATLNHLREDFIETSSGGTIFHTHEGGKKVEIKSSQTLLELFINASKQWHKAMVAEILAKLILIQKYDTVNVKESIKRLQKYNILRKFNSDKINGFDYSSLLRLYSNRNIMTVSGENLQKICSEITKILEEPLIPTYEIHTEIVNNFFNSFKVYSEQATEDELDEIIRHDIKSRNYESEDTIFLKFHEAVEKWWKQTGNVPFLTKNCKIFETAVDETKLANLHSSSLNRVRTDLFKFRRNEIVKPKWVKIHEDIQSQEHFFMNISSSIPELSCVKFMQFFQWFEADFNFIIIDNSDVDTITELLSKVQPSCVKIVYLPRFEPAAIEMVRLAVKKSIVITTQPYQGDWTCIQDETKNLLAFETSSQERLLESVVTFQGEQIPLKTLIDQAPRSLIDGVILRKLVEGEQFAVSNFKFSMEHEEFYIPRTLTNNRQISKSDSEIRDRVVIVAAEPGMGKSTLLTNLASAMKKSNPANWIIRINLVDYSKLFDELSKNCSVLDKDYALSFLQNLTISGENREIGNFEREIFQWYCEQYKIHLLIDGFDEISPDYTNTALNLLKLYKENFTASLWVTTRTGGVRRKLEETFNIYSYRLDPFSCVEAEVFLKKYWKNALAFDNRVKIKELDGFMRVPLVLKMLANIYQNDNEENPNLPAFEQMDLITLYDHFIALKFEATIFNNIQEFQHKHKLAAIYTLFNQTEVKAFLTRSEIDTMDAFSQEFNNLNTKTGLIKKIIDDRPIFVHHIYAEFFAAQFIWEKYSSLQNDDFDKLVESILIGNFVRYDRIQITNFLKEISKKSSQICANIVTKTCKFLSTLIDQSPTKFHKYNKQVFYDMLGMVEHFLTLDSSLHSTLQTLVKNKPVTKRNMLLLRAFECGYIELIRTISDDELIIETLQEISSNSKSDSGFTPLHWAAKKNLPEIASLLLREGAPIDSVTKLDGSTALHLAVSHGNTQIVQVLLDRGADLNHRTVHGKTALHLAVEKNFCEIAAMLVKKGAPLCGSSTDDIPTPLQLAMEKGHEQMVQLLKDLQPRGYYQKKFSTFK